MAYDSSKPANGGSLVSADIRENFRALKEDGIVLPKTGTGATDACAGNDAILSNTRTPTDGSVTEAILAGNTQNALIVLPVISIFLNDIELAPDRKKGTGTVRTTMVAPPGSLPNEVETLYQKQPIPYNFIFDVTIWSYNSQQDFQIAEQILTLFDPTMQIQTSDSRYDPTSITTIELMNVQDETEAAIGTERRMLKRTYTFTVIWLNGSIIQPSIFSFIISSKKRSLIYAGVGLTSLG